jgi:hypothetical protein
MWVNKTVKRGRSAGSTETIINQECIIVNKLKTAKATYQRCLNAMNTWDYAGYAGKCQLFIPHIHEDGQLAYWPDNEKYILQAEL